MSSSRTSKVFALSLGQGLTTVITLASSMVMARVLSQTELATYRQTMLAYSIALPLLGLGVSQGIYYFLPTEKTRARGLVVDGLVMMVTMGLLYAVFIALGGNHVLAKRFSNPAIVKTLVYLVPLPIIMLPAGLLASVMVVQDRVNKLTVYNVLTSLLMAASVIVACLLWKTPEAMILMKVGVSIVIGVYAIGMILHAVPKDDWHPRFSNMKTMVAFSIPLVLAGALGTISLQLDKIIVSSMCTPEAFAVYSTGALEIPVVGMITGSIASVILPDLRRMVAEGDKTGALALFRKAAEKSAIFIIPIMMFLMVSAEPFILTLFSSKYAGSVLPFQLYLLILPVRIVMFGSFMTALGLNKMILYRSAIGVVANLVLSILFVYWWGYIGAIIATILTLYAFACVWNFAVISRAVECRWWQILPFGQVFKLVWVSALACVPFALLMAWGPVFAPVVRLAVNGICFALTLAALAWVLQVEPLTREGKQMWIRLTARWRA
jgi:O-antigen/teichoic acid export membrane protein